MKDQPPPFSALRTVEAAARHRSFTWAAKELQVTHSAVSQSIKRLEADLGTVLFERKGSGMEPSDAALRLANTYSEAASSLGRTLQDITRSGATRALSVHMPTEFGRLWFSRRMARLTEALPDLAINARLNGAGGEASDFEIVYSDRPAPRGGQSLASINVLPLASPAFAAARAMMHPLAVASSPLLAGPAVSWDVWSAHYGVEPASLNTHAFDDVSMALDAAAGGAGVVLADLFSAESWLESGALIALPFPAPTNLQLQARNLATGLKGDVGRRFEMWLNLEVSRSLTLDAARRAGGR